MSLAALTGLVLVLVLFGSRMPAWFIAAALASAAAVFATMWLAHILPVVVIGLSAVAAWKPSTGFDFVLAAHAGRAAGSAADL